MVKSTVYLKRVISAIQVGYDIHVGLEGARILTICDADLREISIDDIAEYVYLWEGFLRNRRSGTPVPAISEERFYYSRGA